MYETRKLQMKRATNVLASRNEIKNVRMTLERETEKDFKKYEENKQRAKELSHNKFLD